jgi:hypothetical protein
MHATVDAVRPTSSRRLAAALPRRRRLRRAEVAFTLCTFWLVEALASSAAWTRPARCSPGCATSTLTARPARRGRRPGDRRMWGNFPQAYSHVGLIHAAFAAAPLGA